ncbi:Hypothetical_protein [Hexamita inflata]|uniref:Hypothetical_protein n=1 Tax=Hexamita inflata TaxID=28002 RepID=A0AA86NP72_9EUKA|nr:Hypothetical protein HINF_LOCUS11544 [Hexamita inflata]CAI9923902.1 Hypothetical protein HINF_LOCUS11547 [Hexamita inflata]CAI9925524.1 Hypothetical protein HINF_LOCUS13169 [Hexamita inflata]CAI9925527.1 Hypothetical protein HINF_LOCUS13172 [Hexamita inflata]CAI9966244.1 Hypothetical protein HINF_LOCUS53889 [Hexamita inflata]
MKYYSLLSQTSLYPIVWDNIKPLLCNKKMTVDGYRQDPVQQTVNLIYQSTNQYFAKIQLAIQCTLQFQWIVSVQQKSNKLAITSKQNLIADDISIQQIYSQK